MVARVVETAETLRQPPPGRQTPHRHVDLGNNIIMNMHDHISHIIVMNMISTLCPLSSVLTQSHHQLTVAHWPRPVAWRQSEERESPLV